MQTSTVKTSDKILSRFLTKIDIKLHLPLLILQLNFYFTNFVETAIFRRLISNYIFFTTVFL